MHIILCELAAILRCLAIFHKLKIYPLGHERADQKKKKRKKMASLISAYIYIHFEWTKYHKIRGTLLCSWGEYAERTSTPILSATPRTTTTTTTKTVNIYKIIITAVLNCTVRTAETKLRKCSKPKFSTLQNSIMWCRRRNKNYTNENKCERIYFLWPHHFLALHRTGFYVVYIYILFLFIWENVRRLFLLCGFFSSFSLLWTAARDER